MSLSFREQAAIALLAQPADVNGSTYTMQGAVGTAQALANACCDGWGHDDRAVSGHEPSHPPTSERAWAKLKNCRRCGKETTP